MSEKIIIEVVEGDALAIDADVLALKYAQQYYGVDELVAARLEHAGIEKKRMSPRIGRVSAGSQELGRLSQEHPFCRRRQPPFVRIPADPRVRAPCSLLLGRRRT